MVFLEDTIPFRSIENVHAVYSLGWLNHHAGQRKLFLGLLDCVLKMLEDFSCRDEDILLVYAGASGKASAVLTELFPRIKIILFDPDENTTRLIPATLSRKNAYQVFTHNLCQDAYHIKIQWNHPNINMYICTQNAGWFDDAVARIIRDDIFPRSERRYNLFISDIRVSVDETAIQTDMKAQARWTMLSGADMYMLKFRLPYDESLYVSYDYVCDSDQTREQTKTGREMEGKTRVENELRRHYVIQDTDNREKSIMYLDGNLVVQLHAPQMSAELRLIGKPVIRDKQKKKYVFRYYDVHAIEDKMVLFNLVYRSHAQFACDDIFGKYEHISDVILVRRYAEFLRKNRPDTDKTVTQILQDIQRHFSSHVPSVVRKRFIEHLYDVFTGERGGSGEKIPSFLRTLLFRDIE